MEMGTLNRFYADVCPELKHEVIRDLSDKFYVYDVNDIYQYKIIALPKSFPRYIKEAVELIIEGLRELKKHGIFYVGYSPSFYLFFLNTYAEYKALCGELPLSVFSYHIEEVIKKSEYSRAYDVDVRLELRGKNTHEKISCLIEKLSHLVGVFPTVIQYIMRNASVVPKKNHVFYEKEVSFNRIYVVEGCNWSDVSGMRVDKFIVASGYAILEHGVKVRLLISRYVDSILQFLPSRDTNPKVAQKFLPVIDFIEGVLRGKYKEVDDRTLSVLSLLIYLLDYSSIYTRHINIYSFVSSIKKNLEEQLLFWESVESLVKSATDVLPILSKLSVELSPRVPVPVPEEIEKFYDLLRLGKLLEVTPVFYKSEDYIYIHFYPSHVMKDHPWYMLYTPAPLMGYVDIGDPLVFGEFKKKLMVGSPRVLWLTYFLGFC